MSLLACRPRIDLDVDGRADGSEADVGPDDTAVLC